MKAWHIIITLALVIIVMIFLWPDTDKHDNQVFYDRIAELEDKSKAKKIEFDNLLTRIKEDSAHHANDISVKVTEVKNLKATVSHLKANPRVVRVRDSIPEVDTLLIAQDSLIANLETQLTIQGKYIADLQTDVNKLNENFNQRLRIYEEKYALMDSRIQDQQKQIRKARRTGRLFKAIAIVGFVGGVFLGTR